MISNKRYDKKFNGTFRFPQEEIIILLQFLVQIMFFRAKRVVLKSLHYDVQALSENVKMR